MDNNILNLQKSKDYNHKKLRALFHECSQFIGNQHCMYIEAIIGFNSIHDHVKNHQAHMKELLGGCEVTEEDFMNQCGMTYKEICGRDITPMSMSPLPTQGELVERNKPGGLNEITLGQQTIVAIFSYWEKHLRFELAKGLGFINEDAKNDKKGQEIVSKKVKDDFWADLMYLRRAIVHHGGRASDQCIKKCEIFTHLKKDEIIFLPYEILRKIFLQLAIYRNKIHELSFSPNTIRINPLK